MDTAPEEPNANPGTTTTASGSGSTASATSSAHPPYPGDEPRLRRGRHGKMLAGVAVGVADYFDVDPTIVRIGFVALAFLGGLAVPLYLAGWLLIPDEESDLSVAEELLARERARGAY
jgi:phage shock protein PspC (stress-responsive transcriptional regulator)